MQKTKRVFGKKKKKPSLVVSNTWMETMYHKKYYLNLNIIKKLTVTNPPIVFSLPKVVLFFFQGKEVINLVQYSLFRNQKKKERNEKEEEEEEEEEEGIKERPREI
jgi:hypothetical protein